MDFRDPEHLAGVIDNTLEFAREFLAPDQYQLLCRKAAGLAIQRTDSALQARRWVRRATQGLRTTQRRAALNAALATPPSNPT